MIGPERILGKKDKKSAIKDFKTELKKVTWPTPKELVNKTGASLMVVGDDYQAIYRFQGCDISLF